MVSSEGHSAALAANFVFHSFSESGGVGEGGESEEEARICNSPFSSPARDCFQAHGDAIPRSRFILVAW